MNVFLRLLSAALLSLGLYPSLALHANADIAAAQAALDGDMKKLRFHDTPQAVAMVRFMDFDGDPVSLAQYQGQVVVLNFWATWCGPCRQEMPMLSELQEVFKDAPVQVVTVATGRNAPPAMVRFFDKIGVDNLPLYRDPKQKLAQAMGVSGLPTTVILDPQGREIARMQGEADWASASAVAMLRALIPGS